MPHLRSVALSILIFLAVSASAGTSQTIPSPYTFIEHSKEWTVLGGRSFINPGQLGIGPRNANVLAARFAVAFSGAMGLDITGALFDSKRDVLDVSRPEDDRVMGRSDIPLAMFDARLRLSLTGQRAWHGLQPFIMFGGGIAFATSTTREVELLAEIPFEEWYAFGTRFAATFGGGTTYHMTDKISLRLEGVFNLWKIATPIGWLTVDANPNGLTPADEWVSGKSVMLGVSWRF